MIMDQCRHHSLKVIKQDQPQAVFGETPLPFAPRVTLQSGETVVPQQFLKVQRSVANLEEIIQHIECFDDYLVFVDNHNDTLSIQIGIIGQENYPQHAEQAAAKKIVYGRRWLIEPSTPTSEVVQTVMLAIKKAREHELREKVTLRINDGRNITTPFNSHMDLPLMQGNAGLFINGEAAQQKHHDLIEDCLNALHIDSMPLSLEHVHQLNGERVVVDIKLGQASSKTNAPCLFPELQNTTVSVMCEQLNEATLLHGIMAELIRLSDRHIEENFRFKGFQRFSQTINPKNIAHFSYTTRKVARNSAHFEQHFKQMSYDVDAAKAPYYAHGELGQKQRNAIHTQGVCAGYLPLESNELNEVRITQNGSVLKHPFHSLNPTQQR